MGYNLEKGYLSCWRCRGKRVLTALEEITGENRSVLQKLLDGLEVKADAFRQDVRGKLTLPGPLLSLRRSHAAYLVSRGFNVNDILETWDVRSLIFGGGVRIPEGKFIDLAHRIFIPIKYKGETVSWTSRTVKESVSLRYISAPAPCEALNHKSILYGEEYADHAVCVCEGPLSTWAIGRGGVGTSGTGFTRAQVLRLSRYNVRGVCFDAEANAQRHARELCDQLSVFDGETINFTLETGKDPAESQKTRLGRLEIKKIRKTLGL